MTDINIVEDQIASYRQWRIAVGFVGLAALFVALIIPVNMTSRLVPLVGGVAMLLLAALLDGTRRRLEQERNDELERASQRRAHYLEARAQFLKSFRQSPC
ncbi:MAG: hypothetical protein JRI68_09820 [Deltaproteobacteria bacterium]|nr:hypothetical protein [Deltaproteobacteria bacterium]